MYIHIEKNVTRVNVATF